MRKCQSNVPLICASFFLAWWWLPRYKPSVHIHPTCTCLMHSYWIHCTTHDPFIFLNIQISLIISPLLLILQLGMFISDGSARTEPKIHRIFDSRKYRTKNRPKLSVRLCFKSNFFSVFRLTDFLFFLKKYLATALAIVFANTSLILFFFCFFDSIRLIAKKNRT